MGTSRPAVIEATPTSNPASRVKRQRRSLDLKRRIVEETLVVGASVARVAQAHGVNANQVFQWRRLYEQGRLGSPRRSAARLLPVSVTATATAGALASAPGAPPPITSGNRALAPGMIDLELRQARVRIEGNIDPALLRLVLQSVLG
jgi:transposase